MGHCSSQGGGVASRGWDGVQGDVVLQGEKSERKDSFPNMGQLLPISFLSFLLPLSK